MLENFQYFFYGYPKETQSGRIYALYQPVADAFLICTPDCNVAQELKMLLSSRYSLYLVEITQATNYRHNLIDNTLCEQWSFAEKNQLEVNKLPQYNTLAHAQNLCASTGNVDIDWIKEKKYAMMCVHWIEFFQIDLCKKFESELAQCIGYHGLLQSNDKIRTQVMNLLYFGRDLETTDSSIRKIVND